LAVPTLVTVSKRLNVYEIFRIFLFIYPLTLPNAVINRTVLTYQYTCLYIYVRVYMSVKEGKRHITVTAFQVTKKLYTDVV